MPMQSKMERRIVLRVGRLNERLKLVHSENLNVAVASQSWNKTAYGSGSEKESKIWMISHHYRLLLWDSFQAK